MRRFKLWVLRYAAWLGGNTACPDCYQIMWKHMFARCPGCGAVICHYCYGGVDKARDGAACPECRSAHMWPTGER